MTTYSTTFNHIIIIPFNHINYVNFFLIHSHIIKLPPSNFIVRIMFPQYVVYYYYFFFFVELLYFRLIWLHLRISERRKSAWRLKIKAVYSVLRDRIMFLNATISNILILSYFLAVFFLVVSSQKLGRHIHMEADSWSNVENLKWWTKGAF